MNAPKWPASVTPNIVVEMDICETATADKLRYSSLSNEIEKLLVRRPQSPISGTSSALEASIQPVQSERCSRG
jgi:hypothetical protein